MQPKKISGVSSHCGTNHLVFLSTGRFDFAVIAGAQAPIACKVKSGVHVSDEKGAIALVSSEEKTKLRFGS
jgi:hypothetical protein